MRWAIRPFEGRGSARRVLPPEGAGPRRVGGGQPAFLEALWGTAEDRQGDHVRRRPQRRPLQVEWAILAERDQRIGRVLARLAEKRQRSKTTADRKAHLRVGECALRDHQPSPAAHQTTDGRLALDRAKIAAIALNILLVASISAPLYLLNARTDALRS